MRGHAAAGLMMTLGCLVSCTGSDPDRVHGDPGTPLPGLTQAQLGQFQAGAALFNKVYSPDEGMGPLFNENQCSACHTSPAIGGTTGFEFVRKATRSRSDGTCDLLIHEGGENIRSQATRVLRAAGIEREEVPPSATEVGRFTTPFLFGLGLVEAIPDETILAREDPDDADGDGISGRAGRTLDGRLARFGRKADVATIREFIGTALRFEMGLTTPLDTTPETLNGAPLPEGSDPLPEPEVDDATLDLLTAFVRFLAPTAPIAMGSRAYRDTVDAGRRLFERLGCPSCHVPTMRTGRSEIAALDRKTVRVYSDFLLHDMGPDLASVCGPSATPRETRTEMLTGLQHRDRYLHDGRTLDLREAILAHGGEARRARDAFAELSWLWQEYVVRFLQSL